MQGAQVLLQVAGSLELAGRDEAMHAPLDSHQHIHFTLYFIEIPSIRNGYHARERCRSGKDCKHDYW